jgi:hypothetical protein
VDLASLQPESVICCERLRCRLSARVCVARQVASASRTADTWRGQAAEYPTCVTEKCGQGTAIRAALKKAGATDAPPVLRRTGFKTQLRSAKDMIEARRRLERLGLLGPVSTIDGPASVSP